MERKEKLLKEETSIWKMFLLPFEEGR